MKRTIGLLILLSLVVLASMFVSLQTANARTIIDTSIGITYGPNRTPFKSYTIELNQEIEFTARASGGKPPYSYQWSTLFIPDGLPEPFIILNERVVRVKVPGTNSSSFNFTATAADGTYIIKLKVTDSEGNHGYADSPNLKVRAQPTITPKRLNILFLTSENQTFIENSLRLNFTVNNSFSKITYSLDGQENATITGNSTISELPHGAHNVTVYVWDEAGNVGASETLRFSIAQPASNVPIVVVCSVVVVIVVVGLSVNLKKKRQLSLITI
jgi:hypothetical protein